ncbi:hypothetical protein LCGC14_1433600, partial [marine sediment metagenome]
MLETFELFNRQRLRKQLSSTPSPASASGPTRSGSPGGPTMSRSGPARALASRSASQVLGGELPTPDTSGPSGDASSRSAALQSFLESRLRAKLAGRGSPLYVLTWKHWDMPSGPPICALRARAPRTSGSGFGGWPTPCAGDLIERQKA